MIKWTSLTRDAEYTDLAARSKVFAFFTRNCQLHAFYPVSWYELHFGGDLAVRWPVQWDHSSPCQYEATSRRAASMAELWVTRGHQHQHMSRGCSAAQHITYHQGSPRDYWPKLATYSTYEDLFASILNLFEKLCANNCQSQLKLI